MAFQMIPPRLSSSPPPLDSLPPVACPGDDDEFDHFSSHNASFDITGLSDKLPPTPEASPSKFLGLRLGPATERSLTEGVEGTVEDSISQDSGVDSSNHPHEFSPQPQGDGQPCSREDLSGGDVRTDKEFSDSEQNDVDDFGDFQSVCVAGETGAQKCLDSVPGTSSQEGNDSQISSQMLSQESKSSKCEESESTKHRTSCSPPPLDCVAENTVIEDGFTSSFLPPDDEADFGDFASHEASFEPVSDTNHSDNTSPFPNYLQPDAKVTVVESDHERVEATVAQQVSCAEKLQHESQEEEDSACKPARDGRSEVEGVSEVGHQGEDFAALVSENTSITSERTPSPPLDEGSGVMATFSRDVEESSGENKELEATASVSGSADEARTGEGTGLEKGSPSLSGINSAALESEGPVMGSDRMVEGSEQEVEPSSGADATEHGGTCGSDDASDFGDFNQANEDEDDLDFADLRKEVEGSSFDDFGDFSSGIAENNYGDFVSGEGGFDNKGCDEFGDFTASADTEDKAAFGDFGDFKEDTEKCSGDDDVPQDFDDFGEFSAPESSEELQGFTAGGVVEEAQFPPSDDGVSRRSIVIQKLESLVAKWIPRAPVVPQEESCPMPLLHQTIESDAFVWRQLENLESSAALKLSWSSTQAHSYFLSSVNVDARNILFGQKWSSSVPLFAQTLSFSPLTPAKSTEGRGAEGSSGVGLAGATKELSTETSASTTIKHGEQKKESVHDSSSTRRVDKGSEEQIPPAKFDWTSSGLTNPLEGPAYSSPLFGLDLLLTNTKIGKGATNALLASLEQEFLSEGGEKGSSGRAVKSPPTPSPLVQQILGGGMSKVPTPTTPLQSLAPEVRQVVTQLPDLSFMRSRVLMFPIRGEQ